MSVIRVNKTKNYTVMSNEHLNDKRLSLKAKGLLSVMLSLPDTWDYSISGLVAMCKESETAVKSTLNELKSCGYLVVTKKMPNETESGRIEYVYDIFEKAQTEKQLVEKQGVEKQGVENLGVENLGVENVRQLSTKESSTKESSTDKKKERKRAGYDEIIASYTENGELRSALVEFVKMRKMMKKPLTDKGLSLLLTSKKGLDGLASNDAEKIDVVQQSIMRGWLGFFPLKDMDAKGNTVSRETTSGFNKKVDSDYYYQSTGDEEVDKVLGLGKYAPNKR
nr:MAG: Replication initiator protein A (RepA) N-terminus [Bacteriophage sp.]